jgi:microcystin-dependent protein
MSDQCVGEIRMFAGRFAPKGWVLCNGQLLSVRGHEVLYSLLGTIWGGNGATTFAVPDLRGRIPISQGKAASNTTYSLGETGGVETVALTSAQMPVHAHTPMAMNVPANSGNPAGKLLAQAVNSDGGTHQSMMYWKADAPVFASFELNPGTVAPTGEGRAHSNLMPCVAINFIIAVEGEYPPHQV